MRLVRNIDYWQPNRPLVDTVRIRTMPDAEAATAALEADAAHIVWTTPGNMQRLKASASTTASVLAGPGSYDILLSCADEPFTDKRVRQAIDLAIDRKRFAETLMYGLTDPTYILWMKNSPAWDAAIDVGEFNLDKARQLLVDAGHASGFETTIQANGAYPELTRFTEVIQADLARIGVKLTIQPMEAVQANALVTQGGFSALMTHGFGSGDGDPAFQFSAFMFRPVGNTTRFQSDAYTSMVTAARRESDFDKRMSLYRQLALFIKDAAFVLPIANIVYSFGLRKTVHGFERQAIAGAPNLENLWLA